MRSSLVSHPFHQTVPSITEYSIALSGPVVRPSDAHRAAKPGRNTGSLSCMKLKLHTKPLGISVL